MKSVRISFRMPATVLTIVGAAVWLITVLLVTTNAMAQVDITDSTLPHSADSYYPEYKDYRPLHASDNMIGLDHCWHSKDYRQNSWFPHWIAIDLGSPRIVKQLNLLVFSEDGDSYVRLKDFLFEGSNDDIFYAPVHEDTLLCQNYHNWQTFLLNNTSAYRFYRLRGLNNWVPESDYLAATQMILEEWEMFEDEDAPAMPQNLAGRQKHTPPGLNLSWRKNLEADLGSYAVYRDISAEFVPDASNLISSPADTAYFDGDWRWNSGFYYKVSAIDIHFNESLWALLTPDDVTGVDSPETPRATILAQNVPNPFNPVTMVRYYVPTSGIVGLRVYDVDGRLVRVLVNEPKSAGEDTVTWDGKDGSGSAVASGVYFYRLTAGDKTLTKKMVLLK